MADQVRIGVIVGAHGVRGAVRIKSFTEIAADIGYYSPVEDQAGRTKYRIKVTGEVKGLVVANLEGIADRDAAEAMKGTELWVPRDRLPRLEEDEFLYSDLIGLAVWDPDGNLLGRVRAVQDFGAGDVLDVALSPKGSLMVPFTKADVPEVNMAERRLVVVPPVYAAEEEGRDDGE
jgi:16S rRNA processing protein RimM